MYLKEIDIHGFRGIKHLALDLNKSASVLVGENRWGRSSLISALMLLSLDKLFYQFTEEDFFFDDTYKAEVASIRFTFAEIIDNELQQEHYLPLNAIAIKGSDSRSKVITLQVQAHKRAEKIVTKYIFLDHRNNPIYLDHSDKLVELLVNLNPMMQLKNPLNGETPITNQPLSDYYIEQLSKQLTEHSQSFSPADLERGLVAAKALLEYYLVDKKRRYHIKRSKFEVPSMDDWNSLDRVNTLLDKIDDDYTKGILLGVFNAILSAKGDNKLLPNSIPILIMEEPESQLHPIILSVSFRLLNHFPTQKIVTTNSSDLISLFSLPNIYHLIRKPNGIMAMHIGQNGLNASDTRRILFHILYRRASAMFARCWFLVEGETEIWLLRELAEQSGYHLSSEGVQLIEFAQCGLKPLIRYANKMGISWYVLTDGDMAGKKYAETVRSLCPDNADVNRYLTVLPAKDIETFLFKNGFSHIFKMAGYGTTQHIDIPISKIIQKAIHRRSKPDLAIDICDNARERGPDSIPSLLKHTFNRVVKLAKESY